MTYIKKRQKKTIERRKQLKGAIKMEECPVCFSDDKKILLTTDSGHVRYKCKKCGEVFVNWNDETDDDKFRYKFGHWYSDNEEILDEIANDVTSQSLDDIVCIIDKKGWEPEIKFAALKIIANNVMKKLNSQVINISRIKTDMDINPMYS